MLSDSRIPGFHKLSISERIEVLAKAGVLSAEDVAALQDGRQLLQSTDADKLIENVVGTFSLPLAIAPNFTINGRDYLVPMVVEEPSIVAGVSGAAKLARAGGGFTVTLEESLLAGQIQLVDIEDPDGAIKTLIANKDALLEQANQLQRRLVARGGGARDIEFFKYRFDDGRWCVVVHILVDTGDAMGANLVNTLCEAMSGHIEALCNGNAILRILSNLADRSIAIARVAMPVASLSTNDFTGEEVRDRIVLASRLAEVDPYRAATHNKGILNGVDAVAVATGNDWRSLEAAAHAYAAKGSAYRSLSAWSVASSGYLHGKLVMPIKVGIVGGSVKANPGAALGLSIASVQSAAELACMMAAVGLAQNFAALRALATDGIQKGHMGLHARSVAASVGVPAEHFDDVVQGMIESGDVKAWNARALADDLASSATRPVAILDDDWHNAGVGTACGKVILLGEHAAVYDKHALALPLSGAVVARVAQRDSGTSLELIERNQSSKIDLGASAHGGIAAALALIMRRLKLSGKHFAIKLESRIPVAMGLGSSAAFAVAVIRGFDALIKSGLDDRTIDRLAFDCEKLNHGNPSGIDNNLATYGEPVIYSKSSATRTKPIQLIEPPPIIIAVSGIRGSTLEQVAGVRRRYERDPALYKMIFNEIDEMSLAGAEALKLGDYDSLGALMNVCHGMLNAIEVSTPELEQMINIARLQGAVGAKLTGAGGGGSIVALCPDREDEVSTALRNSGYQVIRILKKQDRR